MIVITGLIFLENDHSLRATNCFQVFCQNLLYLLYFNNIEHNCNWAIIRYDILQEFGLEVVGIDLSSNMLSIAIDRLQKCPDSRIRYCITDALKANFIPESFDYVLSRDALQHNDDIGKLFSNIHVSQLVHY